jgi:hypothetical protein
VPERIIEIDIEASIQTLRRRIEEKASKEVTMKLSDGKKG